MRLVVKWLLLIVGFYLGVPNGLNGTLSALIRASTHLAMPLLQEMRRILVVAAVMRACHLHRRRVLLRRQPLPLLIVRHLLHGRALVAHGLLLALPRLSRLFCILFHLLFQILVRFGLEKGVQGLESIRSCASWKQVVLEQILLFCGRLVDVLVLLHFLQSSRLLLALGLRRLGAQPRLHADHGLAALGAADYRGRRRWASRILRCFSRTTCNSCCLSRLLRALAECCAAS